jgi:hypothetical protein
MAPPQSNEPNKSDALDTKHNAESSRLTAGKPSRATPREPVIVGAIR